MSALVRTNKEINIAEGDFAKKLREALGQDAPGGAEIAIRQEMPEGVATTIMFGRDTLGSAGNVTTMDLTVFGKSVV